MPITKIKKKTKGNKKVYYYVIMQSKTSGNSNYVIFQWHLAPIRPFLFRLKRGKLTEKFWKILRKSTINTVIFLYAAEKYYH